MLYALRVEKNKSGNEMKVVLNIGTFGFASLGKMMGVKMREECWLKMPSFTKKRRDF